MTQQINIILKGILKVILIVQELAIIMKNLQVKVISKRQKKNKFIGNKRKRSIPQAKFKNHPRKKNPRLEKEVIANV